MQLLGFVMFVKPSNLTDVITAPCVESKLNKRRQISFSVEQNLILLFNLVEHYSEGN